LLAGENPQKAGSTALNYMAFARLTAQLSDFDSARAKNIGCMLTKEQLQLLL